MNERIAYYVQQLQSDDADNAYHSLLEIDDVLIPDLIRAYYNTGNMRVRVQILKIIGEHRRQHDIEFFVTALGSNIEEIWKTALDGLVKIGTQQCIEVITDERKQMWSRDRHAWYDEAINQILDRLSKDT